AEALLRECLAVRTRKAPNEWWVFQTKSELGQAASGLNRYEEAEALLLEAHQGLTARKSTMPARYHRYLREAALALADLYDTQGKKDQAARWREQSQAKPSPRKGGNP